MKQDRICVSSFLLQDELEDIVEPGLEDAGVLREVDIDVVLGHMLYCCVGERFVDEMLD